MKRIVAVIIVAAVLAGGYFAFQRYQQQQAAAAVSNLQTVAASKGDLTATVGATGIVRPNQTAQLAWQTTGTVENVTVQVGQAVTNGQVLASLKQTSLPQTIIMAQADLVSAQKALSDLDSQAANSLVKAVQDISNYETMLKDAQYQLDNFTIPSDQADLSTTDALDKTKKELDAARQAFEPYRNASELNSTRKDLKKKLDEAQAAYNSAVKRLQLESKVRVSQATLDQAWKDYNKWKDGPDPNDVSAAKSRIAAAEAALSLASIEAPFNGTITDVKNKIGDQVAPTSVAFRLDDLSRLLVDVQLSEVDINRVQAGQDVTLTFDAIPNKEYNGKVTQVASVGTSTQGVVNFVVSVELKDADASVRPGMTAAVNIVVTKLKDVLQVPNRAVRVNNGKRVVYVMRGGKPQAVEITLGATSDNASEVVKGDLKVGDLIVLNPPVQFSQNGPPGFVGNR